MSPDAVERVLELAQGELSPSPGDKARHRAALGLAPAGAASAGSAAPPRSAARGWSALRASGGAGWMAGALLLGAGAGLGFWLRGAVEEPAPARETAAAPAGIGATAPAVSAVSAPRVALPPPAVEPVRETAAPSAPPAVTPERSSPRPERRAATGGGGGQTEPGGAQPFDAELALLQRVERALRASNPSLAVVLLDELDADFSQTRLGEERLAARRIAECQLRLPGWRQRAERFLSEQRGSVYAQRVRAACEIE